MADLMEVGEPSGNPVRSWYSEKKKFHGIYEHGIEKEAGRNGITTKLG